MDRLLLEPERSALIEEIGGFVSQDPLKIVPVISQHHFMRIRMETIAIEFAFKIVQYCEQSAWLEDPALIIKLLKKWDHIQLFADAINRIQSGAPPKFHLANRPWDTALFAADLPFLNRKISREAIENFQYPLVQTIGGPPVRALIVKGPVYSGRRYTLRYLEYLHTFLLGLNFKNIHIELDKQAVDKYDANDVAAAILDNVKPDWRDSVTLPELNTQQSARWTLQLATAVMEQISIAGGKVILIVSGFGNAHEGAPFDNSRWITAATHELIMHFTDIATGKILAEESGDLLRIVLLGFNSTVTNFKNRMRVDNIKPITATDIQEYFVACGRLYGNPPSAGGLEELVDAVMEHDEPDDPMRTRKLANVAAGIAKGVFKS